MPFTGSQDVKNVSSLKIEADAQGLTAIGIESGSKPWTMSSSFEVVLKAKMLSSARGCYKLLKMAGLHFSNKVSSPPIQFHPARKGDVALR
jgi:hypothetical protein